MSEREAIKLLQALGYLVMTPSELAKLQAILASNDQAIRELDAIVSYHPIG